MFVFYQAIKKLIKNFRPILKFASVKAIVFATYYQSLAVQASSMSPENTVMWNDFILCIEMVFFAGLLMIAFPTTGRSSPSSSLPSLTPLLSEFQGGIPDSKFIENVRSVLSVHDVMQVGSSSHPPPLLFSSQSPTGCLSQLHPCLPRLHSAEVPQRLLTSAHLSSDRKQRPLRWSE
jgi:hypothetical protein